MGKPEQGSGKKVMIVGDDRATRHLIDSISGDEWRPEFVHDEAEALARLKKGAVDLVVTGLQTSGAADIEALRRLRRVRRNLRFIVLTSEDTPSAVIESIRQHAFSYFGGPIQQEALKEMIQRGLEQPAWDDGIDVLSARPEWITLRLKCRMVTAERVVQFMKELETELPTKQKQDIGTAFREMLLNAMEHGGKMDPQQTVDVSYIRTKEMILYQIRDPGEGFSMVNLPHAAISNPPESPADHILYRTEHGMRPGGFGILMTKGLVDELIYNEKGNELILVKRVGQQRES